MNESWEYYDDVASRYDYMYEEPYWVLYHEIVRKLINEHQVNGKILDLGTGTGRWAIELADKGMEIIAVDPAEKMLKVAEEKAKLYGVNIKFTKASGEALPFESNTFDFVLAMGDVLSYAKSPEKVLEEIKRVLKNRGKLLATVDNAYAFLHDFISQGETYNARRFIERERKVPIGDSSVSEKHFYTRPYFPEDIEKLVKNASMQLIDIAALVVFAPYSEEKLARNLDRIVQWELEFCRRKELFGRAEHLFFCARKE
ncbi:class I SAM-dependent methyltransferase [Kosmotoga olearia]|uniref:Methyltransferase type 11 n=1 Tax=Kosmotoga olearia (strain ATCC BAA-1733 / DSM 21960 / TBF 19.5.1) TaxID=521045 RepID=C5CH90_KOSOT|nr:class I SAM-dependent methyltransferase [Kosmotoga olearia]ACR80693.1 Methyltransferase type 11 [Kosmotoga olearia TBF 19.5.1]